MTIPAHKPAIAYFISPHGYGHAARACAVMERLIERNRDLRFEIFTLVPEWFFRDSLQFPFGYHRVLPDIGMVQRHSLEEDADETVRRLDAFLPFEDVLVDSLAQKVRDLGCCMVICDIAPIGIAVARRAGSPSVVIENFTWDWIYEAYEKQRGGFGRHISYLRDMFRSADHHIQTEPVCLRTPSLPLAGPISRRLKRPSQELRQDLELPEDAKVVLITMGGIPSEFTFLEQLRKLQGPHFIVPGAVTERKRIDNVILLPQHSGFFHPDLVNACDAVVGKVGYSTIAETYQAGLPFGYVTRESFRESEILASFIERDMQGLAISGRDFQKADWIQALPKLLGLPRTSRSGSRGAEQAAEFICGLL